MNRRRAVSYIGPRRHSHNSVNMATVYRMDTAVNASAPARKGRCRCHTQKFNVFQIFQFQCNFLLPGAVFNRVVIHPEYISRSVPSTQPTDDLLRRHYQYLQPLIRQMLEKIDEYSSLEPTKRCRQKQKRRNKEPKSTQSIQQTYKFTRLCINRLMYHWAEAEGYREEATGGGGWTSAVTWGLTSTGPPGRKGRH